MEHDIGMLARPNDEADDRRALERLCVATRQVRPVGELLRLVPSPDGVLTPDFKRKLPGRGVWVTATAETFREAARNKAFARSLKQPVTVPADLEATIDRLLERAALDMLSFANKAGLVVAGTAKVEKMLAAGRAAVWIQAKEAAEDGIRKLAAAARSAHLISNGPVLVKIFESGHLDLALGRPSVIHAALDAGPATTGFLERVAALAFWRNGSPAPAVAAAAPETPSHADVELSKRDGRPATDGTSI